MKKDTTPDTFYRDLDLQQETEKLLMLSCRENTSSFNMCAGQTIFV